MSAFLLELAMYDRFGARADGGVINRALPEPAIDVSSQRGAGIDPWVEQPSPQPNLEPDVRGAPAGVPFEYSNQPVDFGEIERRYSAMTQPLEQLGDAVAKPTYDELEARFNSIGTQDADPVPLSEAVPGNPYQDPVSSGIHWMFEKLAPESAEKQREKLNLRHPAPLMESPEAGTAPYPLGPSAPYGRNVQPGEGQPIFSGATRLPLTAEQAMSLHAPDLSGGGGGMILEPNMTPDATNNYDELEARFSTLMGER